MLRQRVLSSVILIPLLLLVIWFGSPWFSILVALAALLGLLEFYSMVDQARVQSLTIFGTLWTLFLITNAHLATSFSQSTTMLIALGIIGSGAIVVLISVLFSKESKGVTLCAWSWGLTGVLYMGLLLSYWVLLRNIDDSVSAVGRDWVLLALFSTFAVDTTAYFVGRRFGRHKMAPTISPAKTWEGAIGGFIGAIVAA